MGIAAVLLGTAYMQPVMAMTDARFTEQLVRLPIRTPAGNVELETTLYLPPGEGPFPVLVMNHGKARGNPRDQERDRFIALSREFVKRGYAVVVPMRAGFAHSSGRYVDDGCNLTANGQSQANDVQGVLDYLVRQPWVDRSRLLVAGQSHGGLTTLAFGVRNMPGVRGLINFAGGLRTDSGPCEWKNALVNAFAEYGAKARIPSLWFYGANDSYFSPALAAALHEAFVNAGGLARLVAFGSFKQDAHSMSGSRDGVRIWWPETERFLKQIGMPTEEVISLEAETRLPKSSHAAIDNIDAVPYLQQQGREQYKVFLGKPTPRAFALSSGGGWSWAEDGDDPVARALASCARSSGQQCRLYAIDDDVVWTPTR
ncbi:MAG: prolyl oligopeptidase family serine peptidase [Herminiimonas sp.]|nr:prolyl oligopeptidase family serine peptidase [Herminiimonas sp.]